MGVFTFMKFSFLSIFYILTLIYLVVFRGRTITCTESQHPPYASSCIFPLWNDSWRGAVASSDVDLLAVGRLKISRRIPLVYSGGDSLMCTFGLSFESN